MEFEEENGEGRGQWFRKMRIELNTHLGVRLRTGILFHGPPGCGKREVAQSIANETGFGFYALEIPGASAQTIRTLFSNACHTAPSIVFIDQIDSIASNRVNLQSHVQRRLVIQLIKCMDESHRSNRGPGHVLVIGATNKPHDIDPALRRPGRFDLEIDLAAADENARVQILSELTRNLRVVGRGSRGEDKNPTFQDLGGMDTLLKDLKTTVLLPFNDPQPYQFLRVTPGSGILLHGPPGCGKTTLARAIANEVGVPFYELSSTELISEISGASERNIREVFSNACNTAPSIVFIDHIDAIASTRDSLQPSMECRIVSQLGACMNESASRHVLVIGATDRVDAIDPALRSSGRFGQEIALGIPDEEARLQILSVLTRNLRVEGAVDLLKIARSTPGFVGADLAELTNEACNVAMERIIDARKVELPGEFIYAEDYEKVLSPEELEKLRVNMADFEKATKLVQPSFRREGFFASPDVKWEDIGGLDSLRQELERCIVRRIEYAERYLEFREVKGTGVLLYGPPGCGKTLIAKAVANEAGVNFMHIKGPEILNGYVDEWELALRTLFARARTCSPCIIFIDEIDVLMTQSDVVEGQVVQRALTQLKVELDDERKDVYVIGATNRPEVMDEAILRPGLLGTRLYVPLPSPDERGLILKALARGKPIDASVDLMNLGRDDACKNFSGADLSALMAEALKEACGETIKESHFKQALEKISPSISDEQIKSYDLLSKSFGAK